MYKITQYTYDRASEIGVFIRPSQNPKYKLDVYSLDGHFITSCGASNYLDFPTYMINDGIDYALERRRLYKIRHANDRKVLHSRGWYADQLLW